MGKAHGSARRPLLKFARLADVQQMKRPPGGPEFFESGGAINPYGRKRVVMNAQNFAAADEFGRSNGIVHAHREVVSDTQGGKFQRRPFADEFHVLRQSGVAGIIKTAFGTFHDEAAGVAAVGAVGQRAGMNGVDKLDAAEIELASAAMVERVNF